MTFMDVFRGRNRKLLWRRVPDDHVLEDAGKPAFRRETIARDEDYIVLRMNEMWIVDARRLWRKFYPMLHAYVEYGARRAHDIVGPGQLRQFGEQNLERVSAFNHLLVGPLPHRGHELKALVGLYAIPGADSAKALVDVVASVAALAGPGGAAAAAITGVVKDSVDKIVGLADTALQVGVENTWPANAPLETGFYVGIDAEDREVDLGSLWITPERRLLAGKDPLQGRLFDDHDYMVLSLERQTHNPGWATLSTVAEAEAALDQIMTTATPTDDKRRQLTATWPKFQGALLGAPDLTIKDAKAIAVTVKQKLIEQLAEEEGGGFEKRSLASMRGIVDPFDAAEQELADAGMEAVTAAQFDKRLAELRFE